LPETQPRDLFARAIELVDNRVQQLGRARRLTCNELKAYRGRSAVIGWRISVGFASESAQGIDILAGVDFPYSRPLIAVSRDHFMHWPHVEEDGIVCSFPESATHNPYDPVSVVERLLGETASLIDECSQGIRMEDFRSEFLSYWNRTVDRSSPKVFSLLSNFRGSRLIVVWRGVDHYLIADAAVQAQNWLKRRYSGDKTRFSVEDALMICLPTPLLPHEYPGSSSDLLRLIQERCSDAAHFLLPLVLHDAEQLIVIMGAPTQNGPALAGLKVSPPVASNILGRQTEVMNRGFRPGNVPTKLSLARFFGPESRLEHLSVERADASWIHGRDRDERAKQLNGAKVAIFGIGSVGGFVAEHLASAGVGDLKLVDPELLTFANSGRHILGVNCRGKSKALEVAELLQARFPHHEIKGFCTTAQTFLREANIANLDLIVCVTGDWATDTFVNERYVHAGVPRVLFGWTEPHAVAGHGVLLSDRPGCLRCHFDDAGSCKPRVTEWDEATQIQEPECGGIFQPYGPVELGMINAMISSVALEALVGELCGSVHRIYAADQRTVSRLGGRFSDQWREASAGSDGDSRIVKTLGWAPNLDCPSCGGGTCC
jgi:sulfur-carrier protein adenylyltransferase/sulfurtransferase